MSIPSYPSCAFNGCMGCSECASALRRDPDPYAGVAEMRRIMTELRRERDEARSIARVLAHAYQTDNRPPPNMVATALSYPVKP